MVVSVCLFLPGAVSSVSLSVFVFSLFLVHCCKINAFFKKLRGLPDSEKGSISAFLSLAYHCTVLNLTHSYVPLHQWKTKQQLTAVMRTTISSAHNQVLSPVQLTVEYISSYWIQEDTLKLAPQTCHSLWYTLFTRWYHCGVRCEE